jgi:GNAT superfamily N-acetyltransferase
MPQLDDRRPRLRLARADEFDRLIAIENDAEAALIEAGVPLPSDYPTMSHAALARALAAGWLVVAVDGDDRPLGFLAGEEREGALLVTEIDVERRHQGYGIGRALMAHGLDEARCRGLRGAMLTTDRLVPFNRRFYETLGFVACTDAPPPPLRAALAREITLGLDPDRRIAMVLRFAQAAVPAADR